MSAWTPEEWAAYEVRKAARQKITDDGTKALNEAIRETLRSRTSDYVEDVMRKASDGELFLLYDFFVVADSDCIFEGLRSALSIGGTKAIWDSFDDEEPEAEPGDDDVFAGERSCSCIYREEAAADTSWIKTTPKGAEYNLMVEDEDGGWQQAINLTRGEYKKLKYYLADLRKLDLPAEAA